MRMPSRLNTRISAAARQTCAATFFAVLLCPSVSAQTPKELLNAALSDLQAHFAFMEVRATINLPATEDGVDVRTWMTPSVDLKRNLNRCSRHGIAVKPGGSIQVGLIKRKDKHIEFHLGAGGWEGRTPYAPQPAAKSTDEFNLEVKLRTAEGREAELIRRQLASLRETRLDADERAQAQFRRTLAEHKRKKLAAGSRFNIRYKKKLAPADLTPESVMAALAPYLEFGPEEETTPPIEPTQPDPPAVTDYEKLKTHVVKIESAKANGQDTGGGVIVGVDGGLVLVATAFHVVEDATDVKVYFMEKQYAPFNATVFQKFHADLDLAVVVVNTAGGAAMPALPEPIKLRKSADIQEGLKVVAIGHSGGLDWQLAFNAVVRTSDPEDGRKLRFSKTGVVPGYSGGGLFDDSGKLLGIVTHIDAQHGLAVKIEDVIKEVSGQWHVPVNRLAP